VRYHRRGKEVTIAATIETRCAFSSFIAEVLTPTQPHRAWLATRPPATRPRFSIAAANCPLPAPPHVAALREFFGKLLTQQIAEAVYTEAPISDTFIRNHPSWS
jgi:hypothetical protein